jgi:hypothetical protein
MKSLRTIRPEPKPEEPVRNCGQTPRAGGASADTANSTRREQRSSPHGPSAGWRLPSGQLLVEYALQTCFTGSPFDRSPFQAGKEKEAEPTSVAATGNDSLVTQGIRRLHAAVDRESSGASTPAPKGIATARAGKERSRS